MTQTGTSIGFASDPGSGNPIGGNLPLSPTELRVEEAIKRIDSVLAKLLLIQKDNLPGEPPSLETLDEAIKTLRAARDAASAGAEKGETAPDAGSGAAVESASMRIWTSTDGKSIRAQLVRVDKGRITLKKQGVNKFYHVNINRLCAADQELVLRQNAIAGVR